jgi:hypothetical protein
MPVTVDQETVDITRLGFRTIGDVLAWAGRNKQMVVRLLIDGDAPDLGRMDAVRQTALADRHIYIETADPRAIALDTIAHAGRRLAEAAETKQRTIALLRENKWSDAMAGLGGCLSGWLEAQQTAAAVAKMLGIHLEALDAGGQSVAQLSGDFAGQLRRIQTAVQDNDLIGLIDLLAYETDETSRRWKLALAQLTDNIGAADAVVSAA